MFYSGIDERKLKTLEIVVEWWQHLDLNVPISKAQKIFLTENFNDKLKGNSIQSKQKINQNLNFKFPTDA